MEVFKMLLFSLAILLMIQVQDICSASIHKDLNTETRKSGDVSSIDTNTNNLVRVRRHNFDSDADLYDGEYEDGEEVEDKEAGQGSSESAAGDTEKKVQPKDEDPFPPDCGFLYKIEEIIKNRRAGDSGTSTLIATHLIILACLTFSFASMLTFF